MPQKSNDFPVEKGKLVGNEYITPTLTRGGPPEQYRLPTLDSMRDMPRAELARLLEHFGVVAPWETLKTEAMKYLTRMSELRPGTPEFQAELERLTSIESDRGILSLSRRVVQEWSSWDAIDGNVNQSMMWLTEMDEGVCSVCADRGGQIMTFAEWQIEGPPGAASGCLGGDMCRCDLIAID